MLRPAVFLDRDQTLIQPGEPDASLDDILLQQGAAAAVASIRGLGYKVVIVANADGVAQGKLTEEEVNAKHHKIRELIETKTTGAQVDAFYFCPYRPKSKVKTYSRVHPNRMPKAGMWQDAAEELAIDLTKSWTIAHQKDACKAGKTAGTRTVHLDPAIAGKAHPDQPGGDIDYAVGSLIEAVRVIAQQRKPESAEDKRNSAKRWDKARIAELQKPRDMSKESGPRTYQPSANKPFRPLDLATTDDGEENGTAAEAGSISADASEIAAAKPVVKTSAASKTEADAPVESAESASAVEPVKKKSKRVRRVVKKSAPRQAQDQVEVSEAGVGSGAKPKTEPTPKSEAGAEAVQANAEEAAEAEQSVAAAIKEQATSPQPEASPQPAAQQTLVVSNQETERLLRQLLQEVRQRRKGSDIGSLDMFAIGLQAMALVCLLGGLLMNDDVFIRWLGAGIIAQLATIALLQFGRR